MRRAPFDYFINHDAKTPYIGLCIVCADTLDNLRGHPVGCTGESVALAGGCGKESRNTKVTDHDLSSFSDENVGCFKIAMNDGHSVKVAQSDQDFPDNDGGMFVLEAAVLGCFHEGINTTAMSKLHDNPNTRPVHVTAKILCNIRYVTKLTEESNFTLDVGHIVIGSVKVDDFQSDNCSSWDVPAFVN